MVNVWLPGTKVDMPRDSPLVDTSTFWGPTCVQAAALTLRVDANPAPGGKLSGC